MGVWGSPHPDLGWGTPLSIPGMGYPHLDLGQGTPPPISRMGTPPPIQTWDWVPHHLDLRQGTPPHPHLEWGTPCLDLGWGTPLPHLGWGTPLSRPGTGYHPPRKCGQTENITFPHTSDAGGKKVHENEKSLVATPCEEEDQTHKCAGIEFCGVIGIFLMEVFLMKNCD